MLDARGQGRFYADRRVLYEEDLDGSLSSTLSSEAERALVHALALPLDSPGQPS